MSGTWSGADELHLSAGPWTQDPDGAWRVLPPADDEVALTTPAEDTDDELTPAESARLDASPEWQAYVLAEVAHYVEMWESAR